MTLCPACISICPGCGFYSFMDRYNIVRLYSYTQCKATCIATQLHYSLATQLHYSRAPLQLPGYMSSYIARELHVLLHSQKATCLASLLQSTTTATWLHVQLHSQIATCIATLQQRTTTATYLHVQLHSYIATCVATLQQSTTTATYLRRSHCARHPTLPSDSCELWCRLYQPVAGLFSAEDCIKLQTVLHCMLFYSLCCPALHCRLYQTIGSPQHLSTVFFTALFSSVQCFGYLYRLEQ